MNNCDKCGEKVVKTYKTEVKLEDDIEIINVCYQCGRKMGVIMK